MMPDGIDPDAVLALARALVALPTVVGTQGEPVEQPAADLVAQVMRGFGWSVTMTDIAPGRPNVVGVIEGSGPGPTLMFEGHTDVVTPGSPQQWTFPPFAADIVGGHLRGRGSADMKAGLAAMIHAARAVQQQGFPGRIIVAALADEEGLMAGAKHFARIDAAALGPIDGVIVGEPEGGEICACAKGALRLLITFTGRMAHGAMPDHGRSPLPAAARCVLGLAELEHALAAEVGDHPLLGRVFLTPTVLAAGEPAQLNVIPATATVGVDVRTVPGLEHAAVLDRIREVVDRACDPGVIVGVEVIDDRPPVDTPVDHPVITALAAAHRAVHGTLPAFGGVPGTTDGSILTRDAGLATVVYGPGGKWIAHQADESVEVADILTCTEVFARAAMIFLAGEHR